MRKNSASLSAFCLLLVSFAYVSYAQTGIVYLQGTSESSGINGFVTFTAAGNQVTVSAQINNLPRDGDFAMHVHEFGDITANNGSAAGGHLIGAGSSTHGCPGVNSTRHEGDMGSWTAVGGVITQTKTLDLLALTGSNSIIGRGVILHELADACAGDTGNAGKRFAQGVIGIANVASNTAATTVDPEYLICKIIGTTNSPGVSGVVWFKEKNDGIEITARIEGLDGNPHGFHMHQFGDLSVTDGTSLGGHWNPNNKLHNLPPSKDRHAGDMGNVQNYDSAGVGWVFFKNELITSTSSIIGRGIIVHQTFDHGDGYGCNNATGDAGTRYGECVIGIAADTTNIPNVPIKIDNNWDSVDCAENPNPSQTNTQSNTNSRSSNSNSNTHSNTHSNTNSDNSSDDSSASVVSALALVFVSLVLL